ncbi:DNA mismatch repair protein MSH6 [Prunus yedoensis var. nudiflora]|uniref:DNA mismatch repair protein MSH6 n=1 Tax=Prunus yedoensis var. nudiflora TaxID=2094558 RepID=A0A314Z857_PRUYE|nr:DNA mismatch repair protein MSH6 [Prunus yedoensis var. nudiflora]
MMDGGRLRLRERQCRVVGATAIPIDQPTAPNHFILLQNHFFPTPISSKSKQTQNPNPSPGPSPSPTTPSPLQSKPKPKKSHGQEVVGKRIRVYWPLDNIWYEGYVKLFSKDNGKHLVQYDDAEEELLDLGKEKIEWVQETVKTLKRLRRGPLSTSNEVVVDGHVVMEDEDEEKEASNDVADDDSSDEDWGKSGDKDLVAEVAEEEEELMELEDEEDDEVPQQARTKESEA